MDSLSWTVIHSDITRIQAKNPFFDPRWEMGLDPTRRDFFWLEGKKLKNLTFLGEIFQTQTIDGLPDPTQVKIPSLPQANYKKDLRSTLKPQQKGQSVITWKSKMIISLCFEISYFSSWEGFN